MCRKDGFPEKGSLVSEHQTGSAYSWSPLFVGLSNIGFVWFHFFVGDILQVEPIGHGMVLGHVRERDCRLRPWPRPHVRIRILFVARQPVSLHVVLHRGSTRRQQYQRDGNGSGRLEKLFGDRRFSALVQCNTIQYNTRKIGNWNIILYYILYIEGGTRLRRRTNEWNKTIPISLLDGFDSYKIRQRN